MTHGARPAQPNAARACVHQRGAALLAFCRDRLEAVEGQIQVLDAGAVQPGTAE